MAAEKAKWFETPESGFGYASRFYLKVLHSLKQKEALLLNASLPLMKTRWFLDEHRYEEWVKLVGYKGHAPQAFTYSAPASVWALMQALDDLSISFSRIMHMGSQLKLLQKDGFHYNQHYTTHVQYLGATPHSRHAVTIRFHSMVKDVNGRDIMSLDDEMYVSGLEESLVRSLNLPIPEKSRRTSKAKLAKDLQADRLPIVIPRSMGQRYGKLSGDLNPLHISTIGARLFGHKSSFIQGLCTLNLVVGNLGQYCNGSICSIDIAFIRPVVQPSMPTLVCTQDEFELIDRDGNLLVAGHYHSDA